MEGTEIFESNSLRISVPPRRKSVRIELGVPVEVVTPAFVQVVGRERAAILLEHVGRRLHWGMPRIHSALPWQAVALPQIAGGASGYDIGPNRPPASGARHQMIESQF